MRRGLALALLCGCTLERIEHDRPWGDDTDDGGCGGTGGLCNVPCSSALDCLDYSDDAECTPDGVCGARSNCLGSEVCGPEASCSWTWAECQPLGHKALGESCVHPIECRSGGCATVCLPPCYANGDCAPTERCVISASYEGDRGHCQGSVACEACDGDHQVCDPLGARCVDTCRTTSECSEGDCLASEDDAFWTCGTDDARCPPDAFSLSGVCFVHDACVIDDDCDRGFTCRPPTSGFLGGYCSPKESS